MFDPQVRSIVKEIAAILIAHNETLAISEAACGGFLSSCIVAVPGASRYFVGGTTVYSLNSRLKLSGLSHDEIETYTGPSETVAMRLARSLRFELGSTWVLSETGFAGPHDLDSGKVFLAVCGPEETVSTQISTGCNKRTENMQLFALAALQYFLQHLRRRETA